MFYKTFSKDRYFEPVTVITRDIEDIYLPIEVDTEFQDKHFPFINDNNRKLTISVQLKPINEITDSGKESKFEGTMFRHPDINTIEHKHILKDYPTIHHDFCAFDLLEYYGYNVNPILDIDSIYSSGDKVHNLYIHLYGFHLVSDITRLFKGTWSDIIMSRITNQKHPDGSIAHSRRLYCYNDKRYKNNDYIDTCQFALVSTNCYRIYIKTIDNCALQGNISYNVLCNNTKVFLKYKNDITNEQKKHMYKTTEEFPEVVAKYALGDLLNYDARQGHIRHLKHLYELLGIKEYYRGTKASIGMCVFDILQSTMMKEFKLQKTEELKQLVFEASHSALIENRSSTQVYLAKTNGGRCYNNRPTEPSIRGIIADVDIKGCYARGLEIQDYPIGRPIIIEYHKKSKINHYDTLRDFLKNYEKELVEGLWVCRISTKQPLTFEQDFFLSWLPPKCIRDILKTDYKKEIEGNNPTENDNTRIYSNEIHLGILQADGLEWIKNYLCKSEREEFLDTVQVIAAGFYPKSLECTDLEEFKTQSIKKRGENYCKAYMKSSGQVIIKKHLMENHSWYRSNIGELLITKLSNLRKKYCKEEPEESTMNSFIKLIINTIYGDLVSPHFYIANTIVGNNVTARARAMAWYMEKSLHGIQTITDGCAFEINKIVKSRYNLTNSKYFLLKNGGPQKDLAYGYLMKRKRKIDEIEELEQEIKEINELVENHIKDTYGKSKVVHQYEVEVRGIYTGIATHGPANYQMYRKGEISKTKMRSYKNYEYINYDLENMKDEGEYSRTVHWLDNIYKTPDKVKRGEPFVEEVIIKTNQYIKQRQRLEQLGIGIGDIDHRVRIINEFNISMYLFKTHSQFETWKREHDELKYCCKQTYEGIFENESGELNYKEMITKIQNKIKTGDKSFYKRKKMTIDHPKKEKIERIENYIREHAVR